MRQGVANNMHPLCLGAQREDPKNGSKVRNGKSKELQRKALIVCKSDLRVFMQQ